ncbi:glutamine--fructose-6-phosphate transaminase (isomerizing) [Tissierella sp. Yu-01]|uniref:glutamine--fructose-6-phosphate transaminase (isomerizing) n=1 Tax=Tissierella sp. Yu-01 TaxID=3035694 RepID=UPI00240DA33A|nr:glutamine--fructose-6-phosphate transaminase (isomerizing) [Tissierella sp. Yu-01]WFA07948.1 glutamine--fructose-6-phosphate transaminase (isomerizing) [Tissierella sp. Yu-01]
MCGIVGYVGEKLATDVILEGLQKLEYRGYDSSGVAILGSGKLKFRKIAGRLSNLISSVEENPVEGTIGIGHTRWATHGAPSDVNAHPHTNEDGTIAVVHNGIIENYMTLKNELIEKGYNFESDTDTEIVAKLLDMYYEGDLLQAVFKMVKRLKGAYALGIVSSNNPDELIAVRKESPLILGVGDDELFVASDIPAILNRTRKVIYLENNDIVKLTREGYTIYNVDRNVVEREVKEILWDVEAATKEGYDHFMIKEINQQSSVIKDTLFRRLDDKGNIYLENVNIDSKYLTTINKIYIVACGTAYHAGLIGKHILEKFLNLHVIIDIASEFRYGNNFVDDKTLMIVVSQSGETADTLAALRLAKSKGARILSITNVVGSTVARESDDIFYTWAGPEIAVASTKAYTTQLTAFYMISLYFGKLKGTLGDEIYNEILSELKSLPAKVKAAIEESEKVAREIAEKIKNKRSLFYIGRGLDYYTAMEGALKLKEISYIQAEAFAAGELKHGSIALIEKDTPVIAIATQRDLYEKTVSNIKEVKARGAYTIGITRVSNKDLENVCDSVIYLDETYDIFMPLLSVISPQLLAYYAAVERGNDVDKPRNLAKSVTVE